MLKQKLAELNALIWKAASEVGTSAPKITSKIMGIAFPRTMAEAEIEGADRMLRDGVVAYVRDVIKEDSGPSGQIDFASIDPSFRPYVEKLHNARYYVESLGGHVAIHDLIRNPSLLDDARKYMRRKGQENLAEAYLLDQLYEAVQAAKSHEPASRRC